MAEVWAAKLLCFSRKAQCSRALQSDIYHRFVSCLVYVPKDRFTTELRKAMEDVLRASFNAEDISFSTYFSESVLARIHFSIRIDPEKNTAYDVKAIEKKLIEDL